MADSQMVISIVVPVYCGGAAFAALLRSLQALDPPPSEVILVLDGAHPDDLRIAEASPFTVLALPLRQRPAAARNAGVAQAAGEVIVFLDADVTAPPGLLAAIAAEFASTPGLAALIGSYDDAPAGQNFLSQYKNLQHHFVHQTGSEEASTFWGACGAIRRDAFRAIGGFDESWYFIEDIELGYRLRAVGYRIRLAKHIQVKHLKVYSPLSLIRSDVMGRALPWSLLIRQRRGLLNDLNTGVSSRLSVLAAGLLLASLLLAVVAPAFLLVAVAGYATLVAFNLNFYRFMATQRGLWFTIRLQPWHILYFPYSGASFAVVAILGAVGQERSLIKLINR